MKALFMASEVRSGSTYIAETISYSFAKSFGVECWALAQEKFAQLADDPRPELAAEIVGKLFINQAGFRSAKLMVKDLVGLFKAIDANPQLEQAFFSPDCAWLVVRRRNKLRQAISLAYAQKSGLYHYYGDAGSSPDRDIEVTPSDVKPHYLSLIGSDDYLSLFETKVPRRHVVFYEDFLADPEGHVRTIIETLEIPVDASVLQMESPKLRPTSQDEKRSLEGAFKEFFLRNL